MIKALRARPFTEQALIAAALASAALLLGAHIFEWAGYPPCQLCLDEREAHWAALAVAGGGLFAHFIFRAPLAAAAAVGAVSLVYAASMGLAFFHVGVEFHFWPGPATCSGGGAAITDPADLAAALTHKFHGPSCDEAAWRLFGVSMAGYNMLFSAGLFALTLSAALNAARAAREARRPAAEPGEAETV